ncbi:MAG: hypothetical protein R3C28_26805 [Pirellulaceae bacterium]
MGWGITQGLEWYRDRYIREYFSPPSTAKIKLDGKTVHLSEQAPDLWVTCGHNASLNRLVSSGKSIGPN